jgi:hypothetical protein
MPRRPTGEVEVQLYSFLNAGARWEWVFNATAQPLHPLEIDLVIVVQVAG